MSLHLTVGKTLQGADGGEAGFVQQAEEIFLGQGPGQAFSPEEVIIFYGGRRIGVTDYIGNYQSAARDAELDGFRRRSDVSGPRD